MNNTFQTDTEQKTQNNKPLAMALLRTKIEKQSYVKAYRFDAVFRHSQDLQIF